MSEWQQVVRTTYAETVRHGWVGVWDAFVSVVTKKPRATLIKPITFSIWVKSGQEFKAELSQASMSIKPEAPNKKASEK
jgi:hypothetical protein